MRRGRWRRSGRLPLRWKLTLGSAVMLLLIFAIYHIAQYMAIEQTMTARVERSMRASMDAMLNHILEREMSFETEQLPALRQALRRLGEQGQLIRITDREGRETLVVTEGIPAQAARSADPAALPELSIRTDDDVRYMVLRAPITVLSYQGTIELVRGMNETAELIRRVGQVMLYTGLGAVLLSAVGGAWLSGLLLRPLRQMTATIRRVREEGWHARMPVRTTDDEMDVLMRMFNEMMDEVEHAFNRQRQFTQDASHELRTPIAIALGHLHLLRRWGAEDPAVLKESLQASTEEIERLRRLVDELLDLTRSEQEPETEERALDDAGATLRAIVDKVRPVYAEHSVELVSEALDGVPLTWSAEHLEQALIILIDNAAKYSSAGKPIHIEGRREGDVVRIIVTDRGVGIAAADLPHVFDRFYRADKARSADTRGTGLGLSIAKRLVERVGGMVDISSTENVGTMVEVLLPVRGHTGETTERRRKR